MPAPPTLPALTAALTAAQDELLRLEQADDLCHVTGAWAAQQRVVRACQDAIVRAMAQQILDECEALARIEPIARDAMAAGAA